MINYWKITQLKELLRNMKEEELQTKVTFDEEYYRRKIISLMEEAQEWGYEQGKKELSSK